MGKNSSFLLSALAGLALVPAAYARPVQLAFSGTISNSNMNAFAAGQSFSLTLTLETSGSPQFISNNQAFYVDHFTSMTFSSGGYSASYSGFFGQAVKYNNLGIFNQDGLQFQAAALAATYQYTNPKPGTVSLPTVFSNNATQSFDNVIVNLASGSHTLWEDYTLPTTYNYADFDQNHSILFAFSGGGFQAGITSIQTSDPSETPEPATGILMLAAGAGLVALRRSRRQRDL